MIAHSHAVPDSLSRVSEAVRQSDALRTAVAVWRGTHGLTRRVSHRWYASFLNGRGPCVTPPPAAAAQVRQSTGVRPARTLTRKRRRPPQHPLESPRVRPNAIEQFRHSSPSLPQSIATAQVVGVIAASEWCVAAVVVGIPRRSEAGCGQDASSHALFLAMVLRQRTCVNHGPSLFRPTGFGLK